MFKAVTKLLGTPQASSAQAKKPQPHMVRPQAVNNPAPVRKVAPSVISADMNILGNIISDGFLDIDGRVEGNVRCASATIRANGKVKGDIVAEHINVYGEVTGLIKAKHVQLFPTARVEGIIMHESLSIQDGAFVDGKFKRTDKVFMDDDFDFEGDDNFDTLENLRLISDNG